MYLKESFDELVKHHYDKEDKYELPLHDKQFPHMDLLCRKGLCPYDRVDGIVKLGYEDIPSIKAFH